MSSFGFRVDVLNQWQRLRVSAGASATTNADSLPLAGLRGATYIITFWNDAEGVSKNLHLDVSAFNGKIKHTVSVKLGDSLNAHANVSIVGSDMVVTVTNDESYALEVELNRLILGT